MRAATIWFDKLCFEKLQGLWKGLYRDREEKRRGSHHEHRIEAFQEERRG